MRSRVDPALLALAVVIVFWGGGFLAIGLAVSEAGGFGPMWLGGTRLLVAAAFLLGLAVVQKDRILPTLPDLAWLSVLGLLAWSIGSGLQSSAQKTVPTGLTALVMGSVPALAVGLAAVRDRRWPTLLQTLAVAMGIGGIALLVGDVPEVRGSGWGGPLLLTAAFAWALQAVLEGRRKAGTSLLVAGAWQMVAGGLGLIAFAWATGEPWPHPTGVGWAGWWFLCVPCAAIGYPLWLYALRHLPVHVVMIQSTLSPMIAVFLAWAVRGETMQPTAWMGMVLALGGATLAVRAPGRLPTPEPATA